GRPLRWAHLDTNQQGDPVLIGFEHEYDAAGNKRYQRSLHDPFDSQRYTYDSASRLMSYSRGFFGVGDTAPDDARFCDAPATTTWSGLASARTWDLDGVGNWSEIVTSRGGQDTSEERYDTSFNEYFWIDGSAQGHDDNGNLVQDGRTFWVYRYDAFNRLSEVRDDFDQLLVAYAYNVDNRRTRKLFGELAGGAYGPDMDYYYTGWQVIAEMEDDQTTPTRQFVYGNYIDEPVCLDVNRDGGESATDAGDDRYFYHQNTLFSVYGLTDDEGTLVEAYEYDPYGAHFLLTDGDDGDSVVNFTSNDTRTTMGVSRDEGEQIANPYTFTGRRYDPETGWHYYRNRYYDSERGRFVSRDPIGHEGGPNPYQYCESKPSLLSDAKGLLPTLAEILDDYNRDIERVQIRIEALILSEKWNPYLHTGEGKDCAAQAQFISAWLRLDDLEYCNSTAITTILNIGDGAWHTWAYALCSISKDYKATLWPAYCPFHYLREDKINLDQTLFPEPGMGFRYGCSYKFDGSVHIKWGPDSHACPDGI
ncbi:RHS repeat-associated core domain-containing protein, partial [bacterium]|nr:RHS repeat-associated core domain-containing protein [bacterium]